MKNHSFKSSKRHREYSSKQPVKLIFLYCEGKETEPNYFKSIAKDYKGVKVFVTGAGKGAKTLIEKAVKALKQKEKESGDKYDICYVVFDADGTNIDNPIKDANANGFQCAWSNECFELWLLLHFEKVSSPIHRGRYAAKLTKHLGREYKKNDINLYNSVKEQTQRAISNAETLEKHNQGKSPSQSNPGTTVHRLIKEIIA